MVFFNGNQLTTTARGADPTSCVMRFAINRKLVYLKLAYIFLYSGKKKNNEKKK